MLAYTTTARIAPSSRFSSWKEHPKEFGNLRTIVHENPASVAMVMHGLFLDIKCRMSMESRCVVEDDIRSIELILPENTSIKVNGWVIGFPSTQYPAANEIVDWDIVAYVAPQDFEHTTYMFLLLSRIITVIANYPKTAKYHISSESREVVPSRIPTAEDQKYNIQLPIAPMGRVQCTDLPTYSMMKVKTLARSLHVDLLRLYGLNEREIRRILCNNPFLTDYCTIHNSMFTEDEVIRAVRESEKNAQLRSIKAQYTTHSSTYSLTQHSPSRTPSRPQSRTPSRPPPFPSYSPSSSPSPPSRPPSSRSRRPVSPLSIRH